MLERLTLPIKNVNNQLNNIQQNTNSQVKNGEQSIWSQKNKKNTKSINCFVQRANVH